MQALSPKRCKHLNGEFTEVVEALHFRIVQGGKLDAEGINEVGLITGYIYHCHDCGKRFGFSGTTKWPVWFARLYLQLTEKESFNE